MREHVGHINEKTFICFPLILMKERERDNVISHEKRKSVCLEGMSFFTSGYIRER